MALTLVAEIAYNGLQMQDEPSIEGILKGSWQIQAPEFVEAMNVHTRAAGHWQLLVPATGPVLNVTVRQSRHRLPMRTLILRLQTHCPPLI